MRLTDDKKPVFSKQELRNWRKVVKKSRDQVVYGGELPCSFCEHTKTLKKRVTKKNLWMILLGLLGMRFIAFLIVVKQGQMRRIGLPI